MPPSDWIAVSHTKDGALARVRLRGRCGDRRLRVAGRDAPRGPQGKRARELDARVRVRERVRDRLIDADLLSELLARRGVLQRVLESEPRDAARLERERRLRASLDLGEDAGVGEPAARFSAAHDSERARLVRRGEDLPLAAFELVDAVAADDRDVLGRVEIRDERPERERPARLARRDRSAVLGRERRKRHPDRREVRAAVERASELLEENGLLEEGEPGAAVLLRDRDAGPAELGDLRPGRLRGRGEELARLLAKRLLLGCEGEVHQRE